MRDVLVALVESKRAELAVLEAKLAALPCGAGDDEPYTSDLLPPGAASWRACLEAARRGELEAVRVGRRVIIPRDAWSAYVESKRAKRPSRPASVSAGDAARLERMGLRAVAGGRR